MDLTERLTQLVIQIEEIWKTPEIKLAITDKEYYIVEDDSYPIITLISCNTHKRYMVSKNAYCSIILLNRDKKTYYIENQNAIRIVSCTKKDDIQNFIIENIISKIK